MYYATDIKVVRCPYEKGDEMACDWRCIEFDNIGRFVSPYWCSVSNMNCVFYPSFDARPK